MAAKKAAAIEPLCRVVRFPATDGVELAGLLYEPARATRRAAIFIHGSGGASVFEARRTNLLAQHFVDAGISWFPFNNRGAHLIRRMRAVRGTRTKKISGGMAFERIRDCVADIDGAIRELRARGYREIHLVGHSTGANKIAVYDHYKPRNLARSYVLLAGGDDSGLFYDRLGERRFRAALEKAKAMIKAKRGEDLVPAATAGALMSWIAFHDMANPDGDYNVFPFLEVMRSVRLSRKPRFRHVKAIRKPALFLYGEEDEYCYGDVSGCVGVLAEAIGPKPNVELAIMGGADHGFSGRESELARVIIDWLP